MPPARKMLKRTPKDYIMELDMEQCDPTRHPDCTARRNVRLIAHSTNSIWLSLADVPWLVIRLADEVSTGGVPQSATRPLEANSPAVAGVNFTWDVDDSWVAVLLDGPHKGSTLHTKLSNFTEDKWRSVGAIHGYGVSFKDSTYDQRKAAALHFLESHCKAMMVTSETP